ncbi:MAG: ribonuclease III [Myxococcaceae bacterium]
MASDKMDDPTRVATLVQRLGPFAVPATLAKTALTHRSFVNEHAEEKLADYERLEFLGDAVLDLAVSEHLMTLHPDATEGELSRWRAVVVNEETLARAGRALGLGELLLLGRGEEGSGGREKPSLLADAFEAVLGAVYVTHQMSPALDFVRVHLADPLALAADEKSDDDAKTRLQEFTQAQFSTTPRYRLVREFGPAHEKSFEVEVLVGARALGTAIGRSKKEAEQSAARAALGTLSPLNAALKSG